MYNRLSQLGKYLVASERKSDETEILMNGI